MPKPVLEIWIRNKIVIVDERREFEVIARLEPGDRSVEGVYDPLELPVDLVRSAVAGIEQGTYTTAETIALGRRLFAALFSGAVLQLYRDSFEPRIRLFIDPLDVRTTPWELLHDGGRFLSVAMPLSRGIKSATPAAPLVVDGPIRVLVVDAFPEGVERLDTGFEAARIERAVSDLGADKVSVTTVTGVTVPKLINAFREASSKADPEPFHVLHFIGHGVRDDGSFALLFEDDVDALSDDIDPPGADVDAMDEEVDASHDRRPPAVPITPDDLVNMISNDADGDGEQDLKLVFLNACRSAQVSAYETAESFAPRILEAGIPALIGMQNVVFDNSAKAFAADFYAALADRVPIDEAFRHAKLAASAINPLMVADLGVPVLYMRSDTGVLFAPRPAERRVAPSPVKPSRLTRAIKWTSLAGLATVVGALELLALSQAHQWYCGSGVRPVTWTCADIPRMPVTTFNVAFAEFDTANGDDRETARSLSSTLFDNVDDDILEFGFTDVWGPNETGAVRGATADEREEAANERADEINADVIVYGRLEPSAQGVELVPEFYVNDRRSEFVEANASELTGGYRFGDSETVDPGNLASANQDFEAAMEGRASALALFVLGLAEYANRPPDYAQALDSFEAAAGIKAWLPSEGQEILYMFIGNAEGKLAVTHEEDSAERQAALERAKIAYEASLAIDGEYARALLGKAEIQYDLAGGLTCVRLNQQDMATAERTYRQAQSATNAPAHADVDLKADYGRARIFTCERLAGLAPSGDPEPLLRRVIAARNGGNARVATIAAESEGLLALHAGLDGEPEVAAEHYLRSAAHLQSLGLDDRAAVMLLNAAYYQSKVPATCADADATYARALDLAHDEILNTDITEQRDKLTCG